MSPKRAAGGERRRPERLEGAPLNYAPENELGVVFLFAHLAKKWRLKVERMGSAFPDCIAYQKTDRGEKRIRIEFEFRCRSFRDHRHPVRGCDWIVCWENNCPGSPPHLTIVELRKQYGLGFNLWIQPIGAQYKKRLSGISCSDGWSVPSRASEVKSRMLCDFASPGLWV